ncbi:hypothetical protein ACROYT_G030000 [Oculina patagonica]
MRSWMLFGASCVGALTGAVVYVGWPESDNTEDLYKNDQAPPTSLDNKGATSNKGGALPTDSNQNTSSQTSSKCTETNSNKEGQSATGVCVCHMLTL